MNIKNYIKSLIGHKPNGPIQEFPVKIPSINKEELLAVKSDEKMITVGLDFGTHQTKVCVESKGGVELDYTFVKFEGVNKQLHYTIPSIIGIGVDKRLRYGYLSDDFEGDVVRYFKQQAFNTSTETSSADQELAIRYSIWYLASIIFDLEDIFGQDFSIQMGAPTDSSHVTTAKQTATRIIASAYKLVEDIFKNDKKKFLETELEELIELTEIREYSEEDKEEYQLRVFPEAYACLKPLTSQQKIARGMSLMIDIGGGTTDISFFTIEQDTPQVYDFFSINMGLNFLTCADEKAPHGIDSNVKSASEIDMSKKEVFTKKIDSICQHISGNLFRELGIQTQISKMRLYDALKNRPIVYCGGGSTFSTLREVHDTFKEIKHVSEKEWNIQSVPQIEDIIAKSLCPILSTAYGLAISTVNDDIEMKPFRDIFIHIRNEGENNSNSLSGGMYSGSLYSDWDAMK
ncbi:MAG: hypothetical protein Q4B68_00080 [Bacteroidales bacterium]|nr:hypothetical protein [Bacteroidales bacterium]